MGEKRIFIIALGGIFSALSLICLYFASFMPGFELTFYAVSSFFALAMVIETKPAGGLIMVVGVTILGFLVVPNKLGVLPYLFFFGPYPLVKFFLEKSKKVVVQILSKIVAFLGIFGIAFVFFKELFFGTIDLPDYPVWALTVGGVLLFCLYDYILTLFIDFYQRRIKRKKGDIKLSRED